MLKDVLDQLGSLTPEEKRAVRRAAHEPADISLPGKHRLVWAKPRRGPLRLERKRNRVGFLIFTRPDFSMSIDNGSLILKKRRPDTGGLSPGRNRLNGTIAQSGVWRKGRRACLRSTWRIPCGFESRHPDQVPPMTAHKQKNRQRKRQARGLRP